MSLDVSPTPLASFLPLRRLAAVLLSRMMARLAVGQVTVRLPDGTRLTRRAARPGPEGVLELHRWRAVRRLALGGDIAFADAYADGDWSSPDLPALLELAARNISWLDGAMAGTPLARMMNRLVHRGRANTRAGSRRNIIAHYDLGNDFYARWLDRGMAYSSALYTAPDQSLEAAQGTKLDRIVQLLGISGGERVLEIGCGWGGLAERIAREGCHVTGLTLSPAQLAAAQDRLVDADLGGRADLRLQDYRDVTGTYDRVVSIEMLEAVGERYWPLYFRTLRQRLADRGVAVLQVITIDDARFEQYRREVDFIQRHVFPGGMLPSPTRLEREAAAAGLRLDGVETFGDSYARTLAEWRRRFHAAWTDIQDQGFPPRFRRLWDYYLAYCEAGFRAGLIDVGLYRLVPAAPGV
ncbi:cyclopropane-fatty-acyl-phospholipid synthase family protein [Nitrospirillum sp. BR 11163]|uniref:cyclopropane-fatty-acyl-phospholipid synthase family protein n=1 Tax=Nitrospirillum sp. BR 11163 TaxID=3104323 RepID=UPI002AFFFF33|nr:cyclopropane-fatty-acyl-phospholipid synthase family protein [Nitrospirillum sp. BR 11163]MEA1674907.1 cyclopropane-fatty-acyl-phospholipid synthase family protein [Nitrospirillum sp. BR 11163]